VFEGEHVDELQASQGIASLAYATLGLTAFLIRSLLGLFQIDRRLSDVRVLFVVFYEIRESGYRCCC